MGAGAIACQCAQEEETDHELADNTTQTLIFNDGSSRLWDNSVSAQSPLWPILEEMLPYFYENFGNAASTSHSFGRIAKDAVDKARRR